MFFKREKHDTSSTSAILEKYDENPAHQNIVSSYDNQAHTPLVLTKYLNQEVEFLEAILQANKGQLTEESRLYKEVAQSLEIATFDFERAKNNYDSARNQKKATKSKEVSANLISEINATQKALDECQNRYNRMKLLKNLLDEIEKESLDQKTRKELKTNIKILTDKTNEILNLAEKADKIHRKYNKFWGESKENLEPILESKDHKIEKKEINQFDKIVSNLFQILGDIPVKNHFLDEFLESYESSKNKPSQI